MSEGETSFDDDSDSLSVVDDDKENFFSSSGDVLVQSTVAVKRKPRISWVWTHFKQSASGDKAYCFCMLCCKDVKYGLSRSTGMLERHIKVHHLKIYNKRSSEQAAERLKAESGISDCIITPSTTALTAKSSISTFLTACPNFESALLHWMIKTYQPLCVTECSEFRTMCQSLNKRCPLLGRERIGRLITHEYHTIQQKLILALKKRHFALTTDAWTSLAKTGYVTCTTHFIDRETWKLHSLVLGLYEKTGRSRAIDCVEYAEHQMEAFHLHYSYMTCVVTDTEATMVAAGRKFIEHSEEQNGRTKWHGCVDHLLELITGIAFTDAPETLGTMSACRSIVNFFNSSTQAMSKLLSKQVQGRAVRPIQDVVTRWWSTYSMLERLLRLKMYLVILQEEGDFTGNLSEDQWKIAADLKSLLQPFMIAQRLLEGESYITISLVPFMIYKIRKDLALAVQHEVASPHVVMVGTKMLNKLNETFGNGAEGTVVLDNFDEGARRRPKGIPMLTLMASILDPRMKAGIGIPHLDNGYVWRMIKDEAIRISMLRFEPEEQQQPQQQQDADAQQEPQPQQNRLNPNQPLYDIMFEEINNNYLQEQHRINNNNIAANNNDNPEHAQRQYQDNLMRIMASIDAEMTLYAREPSLPLQDAQQKFTCPLSWWKLNQSKYKILSEVALRVLCIPATSAPSERVFSVAGLTIAKDQARLAPHTANELIFLHDALPAIKKYEESRAYNVG